MIHYSPTKLIKDPVSIKDHLNDLISLIAILIGIVYLD